MPRLISFLLAATLAHSCAFAVPSAQPEIYEPGIVSGPANDGSPTLSPDGNTLLFTRSGNGWTIIMESHRTADHWSQPEIASFSGQWPDMQPVFAPDGSYLIYASTRPVAAETARSAHLWRVDRQSSGWSTPKVLPEAINATPRIFKPSIGADGTLYFMASEKGKKFRLYSARLASGGYERPEVLPFSDGSTSDVDPEIAPDSSYLIFSSDGRTPGDDSHEHLFLVRRDGNSWGPVTPIHFEGDSASGPCNQNEARISRDGTTLLFASDCTVAVKMPFTPDQAREALSRAEHWDNGNYNVWSMPLAPILGASHHS